MRVWWVSIVVVASCRCEESREKPVVAEVPLAPAPTPVAEPPPLLASATWIQQRLTPLRADLQARIEYGPTSSPLSVQLELPPGVQVTQGRTFFVLDPTAEPKVHVEGLSLASEALPVKDVVLVLSSGGRTLREPYRFGRR
jgi:hypothetical protein